jgi:uncharacterized tellurite resistance protein B-like protein
MQFLLGLLAILGGGAFWWWRIKMMSEAASDVHDAAGRAYGKYKRNKFRKKVEDSPLEAVEDPVAAATVLLLAIAKCDGPMTDRADALIKQIAKSDFGIGDTTELMTFSKWVVGHVVDPNDLTRRYAKLWAKALSVDERRDFLAAARRVAEVDGVVSRDKTVVLAKLKERLGLPQ